MRYRVNKGQMMKRLKVVGGVAEEVDVPPEEEAAILAEEQAWQAGALDRAKLAKRNQINAARDAEEAAGFDYLGKRFDSNAQAIKRLYGAAMAAQAAMAGGVHPGDVMVTWTTADGSTIDLTYQQAAGVPVVMAQVATAMHVKAKTLKEQIEAAETVEDVEEVQW